MGINAVLLISSDFDTGFLILTLLYEKGLPNRGLIVATSMSVVRLYVIVLQNIGVTD